MSKVLFLGASWFQLPPIVWARAAGHTVLTTDNRPGNPGHALAHRSYDVSTVDAEAVLALARHEAIDGIVAYASDVSAPVAARTAHALGLPGNPVEAVETLCDKARFREFQRAHGLAHPAFAHGGDLAALHTAALALRFPVVVKPVDSSGSKGVSLLQDPARLADRLPFAAAHSRQARVIVEEFIPRQGCQLTGDGFVVDGQLVFRAFVNEHFCAAGDPCAPVGESTPPAFDVATLAAVHREVQAYLDRLGMRRGALNFDILLTGRGEVRVIEIGPRCGGNHIPWLIQVSTGIDLAGAVVQDALGEPVVLRGNGVTRPSASLNLIDLLASRGLRHVAAPHRLSLGEGLAGRVTAHSIQLAGQEEVPFVDGMVFSPAALEVGFFLFGFDAETDMLAAMTDLHRQVQIVAE